MSNRTLSALYGDLGDVLFLEQRWEESYDTFSLAYSIAEEIMREKNDAQSRQDLAFSARKRGDALARMHAGSRAKALYIESIRLVAYEPEELMSPSSRRMLLDTATNFGFLRFMDFEADALLYNAVAHLLKLLEGFEDVPAGSRQYTVNLGLLCDSLSTVMDLASCKEDAEALRIKAGEYLGEERADSNPGEYTRTGGKGGAGVPERIGAAERRPLCRRAEGAAAGGGVVHGSGQAAACVHALCGKRPHGRGLPAGPNLFLRKELRRDRRLLQLLQLAVRADL